MEVIAQAALPMQEVLPELKTRLAAADAAVLVAPPGAGKTTAVPLALLQEGWLQGRKIIMLEPRRLAARSAASYMARLFGEQLGETIGYRVHLDSCISSRTRLEVVTEGILIRMLQSDPALEDVGLLIFDEFHERSLAADLGLALALESRTVLRNDLKLLVMSATIDSTAVARFLGNVHVITGKGRCYPIATSFWPHSVGRDLLKEVCQAVRQAMADYVGDILVFLPGLGEIRTVQRLLAVERSMSSVVVKTLYGSMPLAQQDEAIIPDAIGRRRIILATAIAETSLTVEGVRTVIDSGLMRVPRFSPRTGMTQLVTMRVSRFAADQRQGRAGRTAAGWCIRLWTEVEDEHLLPQSVPEILNADLAGLRLELAAWGTTDYEELSWLDKPPAGAYRQAGELLRQLGAIDETGRITVHGRQMQASGLPPRLAHMLILATTEGLALTAAYMAVLLARRDIWRDLSAGGQRDMQLQLENVQQGCVPAAAARRLRQELQQLARLVDIDRQEILQPAACGGLLALAYPERIGMLRSDGHFLLRSGRGAFMPSGQLLAAEHFIVAADVDDRAEEGRIFLAAALTEQELIHYFSAEMTTHTVVWWDHGALAVRAVTEKRLGALVLARLPADADDLCVQAQLLAGIRQEGLAVLPWSRAAAALRERLQFLHNHDDSWPDMSAQALLDSLEEWLGPHVYGCKDIKGLKELPWLDVLSGRLSWQQRRALPRLAPERIAVPSGRLIRVDYGNPEMPQLAVRLQELFGMRTTPRVAGGSVTLTISILSPAGRPVQVTRDLAGFWQEGYFAVKKELQGRYPKHYWPDDPQTAVATSRVRPREK